MSKVNMSVHRGLSEIKLLTSRIDKSMGAAYVTANKVSNKTIGGRSIDEVRRLIEGNFDSVVALIENRKRIKAALVRTNADTKVNVAGAEYTVAEAIERKASIVLDKMFLQTLKNQFTQQNNTVENQNSQLPNKLETYLVSVLGEKGSRSPEDVKMHTKVFEDQNKFELIDPRRIANYIEKYEKEIDEFASQVDYVLSESNATTFFEVDLVD